MKISDIESKFGPILEWNFVWRVGDKFAIGIRARFKSGHNRMLYFNE